MQFIYAKLAEENMQNTTFLEGSTFKMGGNSLCSVNKTTDGFKLQQDVQAQAAIWGLYFNLISGIPNIIAIILIGSWADVLGRIPTIAYNMTGHIIRSGLFAAVMYWNLPTAYLLVGYFFDGAAGGYFGNLLMTYVYTADVTKKGKQRGTFILIVSNLSYLFYGLVNFGTGYVIQAIGFFWPMIISVILSSVLMIVLVCVTAETVKIKGSWSDLGLIKSLSRVFGFYFKRNHKQGQNVQLKFCLTFLSFITLCQFVLGRWNLEPLYQLNSPFCWDSVKIGIYFGIMSVAQPAASTIILHILQKYWSEEIIAIFGLFSLIVRYIIEGLAFKSWMLYLCE